jgi:ribosomal-protein-alanine N-acetyltransferase
VDAISFRPATVADLPIVASWIATARDCELWAGQKVVFPIDLATLPKQIAMDGINSFVLDTTEIIIGFGQILAKTPERAFICRVMVSPVHRGRGYGEQLVRRLIDTAANRGYPFLHLWVDDANLTAFGLYTKLGFHETAARPGDWICPNSKFMVRAVSDQ